jgi:hypothetical protein
MSQQWYKLMAVGGILAIVAGCRTITSPESASVPDIANNGGQAAPATAPKVLMTNFQQLNGTPYLYAPIYIATEEQSRSIAKQIKSAVAKSASSYDSSSEWDYTIDIRNYLFVHRDNLSASKLLTDNNARILQLEQIGESFPVLVKSDRDRPPSGLKKVTALWYVAAPKDTNGDKLIDGRDRKSIAISEVSGANYTEVIKDIDKIIFIQPKGIEHRLAIYMSGKKYFVADIDTTKRTATVKELPSIN